MESTKGPDRLVLAPAADQTGLLLDLARQLPEPFWLLYVVLVPRTGAEPGRYQIPEPMNRVEMDDFIRSYQDFLERDGRHHLWIASASSQDSLIYDNHNVIYAYGPLDKYRQVAEQHGLNEGEVRFPAPHQHCYNSEYDSDERAILTRWEWIKSPLQLNEP